MKEGHIINDDDNDDKSSTIVSGVDVLLLLLKTIETHNMTSNQELCLTILQIHLVKFIHLTPVKYQIRRKYIHELVILTHSKKA